MVFTQDPNFSFAKGLSKEVSLLVNFTFVLCAEFVKKLRKEVSDASHELSIFERMCQTVPPGRMSDDSNLQLVLSGGDCFEGGC